MADSDIQRAADKRRKADLAKAAPDPAQLAKAERRVRRTMIDEALGDARGGKLILTIATVACLVVPVGVIFWLVPLRGVFAYVVPFGGAIVILALMIAVPGLIERRIAVRRLGQLRKIGRGFDADHYIAQLGEKRANGRVIMRVTFSRPFSRADLDALPDAVESWMPGLGHVDWDGDALTIESKTLDGTEFHPGGSMASGVRTHSNVRYHACVLDLIDRVLPKLAADHPIASFAVEISGATLAWDHVP